MMNVEFALIAVAISFAFTGIMIIAAASREQWIRSRQPSETDIRVREALNAAGFADAWVSAKVNAGEYGWDDIQQVRSDFQFAKMLYREQVAI